MKSHISIAIKMTLVMIVLCCVVYFGIISAIGMAAPGKGKGQTLSVNNRVVGYELVGQNFTEDKYFWGRPSGVDYNAAGSAGTNKGPTNPDYLQIVKERIDTFLVHNPKVNKENIPAELVTASGSGLDPHISPAAAAIQVARVADVRHINSASVAKLIDQHTEHPVMGPAVVHVLRLNIALDQLK